MKEKRNFVLDRYWVIAPSCAADLGALIQALIQAMALGGSV
jgi:hypothetical protein